MVKPAPLHFTGLNDSINVLASTTEEIKKKATNSSESVKIIKQVLKKNKKAFIDFGAGATGKGWSAWKL